jgi:group I intron endonuclease
MDRSFLIYKHTAPNGKAYIGQTNNLHRRNAIHRSTNGCRAFASAIKKYGWEAFSHEVLADGLTLDEANALEVELIARHNTMSPNGYNLKTGGKNGIPSSESIELSAAKRRGRKLSAAQRERLSELGKAMPPERMKKLQQGAEAARKRMKDSPHFNIGRKHGEQHRQRTSQASRANWANPEYREKVIASRTGKTRSPETKAKQAEAARLRWEKRRAEGTAKEDPRVTEKRAAAIREAWRRKKEAALGDLPSA